MPRAWRSRRGAPSRRVEFHTNLVPTSLLTWCLVLMALLPHRAAWPADFGVKVTDTRMRAQENAVAVLYPVDRKGPLKPPPKGRIVQRDREFLPFVTVVQVGTRVAFPNNDNLLHHVYSFSRAKTFEIKLYLGEAPSEVLFDTAGVVALGCNIHDWMEAYVLVVDSPYFARSDVHGWARFRDIPPGRYRLSLWHPHQDNEHVQVDVVLTNGQSASQQAVISVKERPRKPKPAETESGYGKN